MKKLKKILSCLGGFLAVTALMSQTSAMDFKVVLLGTSGVGKTSVLKRRFTGSFESDPAATVGYDFFKEESNTTDAQGHQNMICFIDTAGQERFASVSANFVRGSHVAILMVSKDKSDSVSEDAVNRIVNLVLDYAPDSRVILVGNKVDLDTDDMLSEGGFGEVVEKLAIRIGNKLTGVPEDSGDKENNNAIEHFFTSARTGEGVNELFDAIHDIVDNQMQPSIGQSLDMNLDITKSEPHDKKTCCKK